MGSNGEEVLHGRTTGRRERDGETGARAVVVDGDRGVVAAGDLPGDGKAEAGTTVVTGTSTIEAGEAFEDPGAIGLGDAGAVFGHAEHDAPRPVRHRDSDP